MVFPQIGMVFEQRGTGRLGPPVAAAGAAFGGVPPWEGFASDPSPYFAKGVGPLVDIGVYPLHALTGILGPARRVAAFGRRTRGSFQVVDGPARGTHVPVVEDDLSLLTLELASGVLASVLSSFATRAGSAPELEVLCEGGAIACSLLDPASPVSVGDGADRKGLTVAAERVVVTAVCDPVLERASAAAERFGVPAAVSDIDDLLKRDDVDLVTIVSPIGLHAEHALKAIDAGKHVHVNKTMTTTVDEADRL